MNTPTNIPHITTLLPHGAVSMITLVDALIARAYDMRASDIHIDPHPTDAVVRVRVDGVLEPLCSIDTTTYLEVIARIKICARLRTDEHHTPQDGRLRILTPLGVSIDIRVAIAPTYHGENAVLRLLVEKREDFSLTSLGFREREVTEIKQALERPSGMILATGPTGSGKTTTLYALLALLNTPQRSIITIEDPIEYSLSNVRQIQVNPQTNLTFASGLRSILRQDPDIIMVGEIRDKETAMLSVNTALTGHLLLSTLHTNDAATTLPRLIDMRVEPFLIASTVSLVIGQRLVRRICKNCTTTYTLSDAEKQRVLKLIPNAVMNTHFMRGTGCDTCKQSGYVGRICINEVLVMHDSIRDAILAKRSSAAIRAEAIRLGMHTMLEDGYRKARAGTTTLAELFRVIHE